MFALFAYMYIGTKGRVVFFSFLSMISYEVYWKVLRRGKDSYIRVRGKSPCLEGAL